MPMIERCFAVGTRCLSVRSMDAAHIKMLGVQFAPLVTGTFGAPTMTITELPVGSRPSAAYGEGANMFRRTGPGYVILVDPDRNHMWCVPESDSVEVLQTLVTLQLATWLQDEGAWVLHGAAVWREGVGLAFVGGNGSGKTAMASYLIRECDFALATDDLLPVFVRPNSVLEISPFSSAVNVATQDDLTNADSDTTAQGRTAWIRGQRRADKHRYQVLSVAADTVMRLSFCIFPTVHPLCCRCRLAPLDMNETEMLLRVHTYRLGGLGSDADVEDARPREIAQVLAREHRAVLALLGVDFSANIQAVFHYARALGVDMFG